MKIAITLLPLILLVGCSEERVATSGFSSDGTAVAEVAKNEAITVSFSAGDTGTLAVPEMSCSIMCFPKVKETLESLDGIAAVELVPQKEDGIIDDRRVTVKFETEATSDAAVAALESAGYPNAKFE